MGHQSADPEPGVQLRKWKNLANPKEKLFRKIIQVLEWDFFFFFYPEILKERVEVSEETYLIA